MISNDAYIYSYLFQLDNLLFWMFPKRWVPLYTSVTFSRMRYNHCVANRKWQDDLLDSILRHFGMVSGIATLALGSFLFQYLNGNSLKNIPTLIFNLPNTIRGPISK